LIGRRAFLAGAGVAVFALPLTAGVQHRIGKPPRIGWLTSSVVHPNNVEAFRDGMRALGYREISLDVRAVAGRIEGVETAAKSLGVRLELIETRDTQDIERAFSGEIRRRTGAVLTIADAFLWSERARIVTLARRHRLPGMYPEEEFAVAGGLMAYGSHVPDNFRRTASYVDKILKGAKAADLPVEQPARYKLVINLKTARALGPAISPSLLGRVDEVIH
jgi:hypothetical protein